MVAHTQDKTPDHWTLHGIYAGQSYDPECSCCWLNIPHSAALHCKNTGRSLFGYLPEDLQAKIQNAATDDRSIERLVSGFYTDQKILRLVDLRKMTADDIYKIMSKRYG
jgi:hypothetical protein